MCVQTKEESKVTNATSKVGHLLALAAASDRLLGYAHRPAATTQTMLEQQCPSPSRSCSISNVFAQVLWDVPLLFFPFNGKLLFSFGRIDSCVCRFCEL